MRARAAVLPALALALVAVVLWVQLAAGGGDFVPTTTADPCASRPVAAVSSGVEGLSEELVLIGLDRAACRLGVSREGLVLQLAQQDDPTDAQVDAVRAGLTDAVDRLDREGRLPKASSLADEALGEADLPGFVKSALRALPDSFIDSRLKTDKVLRRTAADLDVRKVLTSLDEPAQLNGAVNAAITKAVKDEIVDGLPHPFR